MEIINDEYKDVFLIVFPYEATKRMQKLYNSRESIHITPDLQLTFSKHFTVEKAEYSMLGFEDEIDYQIQENLRHLIKEVDNFLFDRKFSCIEIDSVPVIKIKDIDDCFCEIILEVKFWE